MNKNKKKSSCQSFVLLERVVRWNRSRIRKGYSRGHKKQSIVISLQFNSARYALAAQFGVRSDASVHRMTYTSSRSGPVLLVGFAKLGRSSQVSNLQNSMLVKWTKQTAENEIWTGLVLENNRICHLSLTNQRRCCNASLVDHVPPTQSANVIKRNYAGRFLLFPTIYFRVGAWLHTFGVRLHRLGPDIRKAISHLLRWPRWSHSLVVRDFHIFIIIFDRRSVWHFPSSKTHECKKQVTSRWPHNHRLGELISTLPWSKYCKGNYTVCKMVCGNYTLLFTLRSSYKL